MKNELVQFSVVESAVREAYEKGRRSVVEDIRTAPGLNGSAAKVLGVLENRIEKAWDESLHPRDRNGKFVTKQEIDKYAGTEQGRTYLLNRVPPAEQGKMRAAIGAALRQAKHGLPNVRHPERKKVGDPFIDTDKPLTPGAQDAANKVIKAQQLVVAVMSGKMKGDIPGMVQKLGDWLKQLPTHDLRSLRQHLGGEFHEADEHALAAKLLNAPVPDTGKDGPGGKPMGEGLARVGDEGGGGEVGGGDGSAGGRDQGVVG